MKIQVAPCDSMSDAIQHSNASGEGEAILLDGKPMVVPQADIDRLAAAGVGFAYLCDHELPDGTHTMVSIPVN